jgi:hypothetical protein
MGNGSGADANTYSLATLQPGLYGGFNILLVTQHSPWKIQLADGFIKWRRCQKPRSASSSRQSCPGQGRSLCLSVPMRSELLIHDRVRRSLFRMCQSHRNLSPQDSGLANPGHFRNLCGILVRRLLDKTWAAPFQCHLLQLQLQQHDAHAPSAKHD